jgi:hypothetical protein
MSERFAGLAPLGMSMLAQDTTLAGFVLAFLRPVDLLKLRIDGDADAPPGLTYNRQTGNLDSHRRRRLMYTADSQCSGLWRIEAIMQRDERGSLASD